MMVVNNVFEISSSEHADGSIKATLGINIDNQIFEGHFPGQAVVPGACMLQILKDVLEQALNTTLLLKKADLKFISMIVPGNAGTVQLDIVYKVVDGLISLNAKILSGDLVCFKFQGSYA